MLSEAPREEHLVTIEPFVDEFKKKALLDIEKDSENSENVLENKPFHNSFHTMLVISRTGQLILRTMSWAMPRFVTKKDILLGELSAAGHDVKQKWESVPDVFDGKPIKRRKRFVQINEQASAIYTLEFMSTINTREKAEIFSNGDKRIVEEAIMVTVPEFDVERGVLFQPNLTAASSPVAVALALADLGTAGLSDPRIFKRDTDTLFREENLDILQRVTDATPLTQDELDFFKARILAWTNSQVGFAKSRKLMLPDELKGIPEPVKQAVMRLFSHFDETIEFAEALATQRATMSAAELIADVGY